MKFLTDVNPSGIMAHWLTQMGYDVVKVGDKNPRMTDEEILNWALAEERIIITTDTDFEEMVWQRGFVHCGILRLENLSRIERKLLLQDTLEKYHRELSSGAIVIAQKRKFRIRRR
jgi:predicted nuclease of predicted toxin-antitoxin system